MNQYPYRVVGFLIEAFQDVVEIRTKLVQYHHLQYHHRRLLQDHQHLQYNPHQVETRHQYHRHQQKLPMFVVEIVDFVQQFVRPKRRRKENDDI